MGRHPVRRPRVFQPEAQNVSKETATVAADVEELRDDVTTQASSGATLVVGAIVLFGASQSPGTKWRACDGAEVSRFDYPEFFTAVGEGYGPGDSSRTFNLPTLAAPDPSVAYWVYVGRE